VEIYERRQMFNGGANGIRQSRKLKKKKVIWPALLKDENSH
jgi:hypothetical protein